MRNMIMNNEKSTTVLYCFILVSLLIMGCWNPLTPNPPTPNIQLDEFDQAEYYAMIALTVALLPDIDSPDVQTTCDVCNGTKRSGDGLGPCPCGKNCKCEKKDEDDGDDGDDEDDEDDEKHKCRCDTARTYCNCVSKYGRCSCPKTTTRSGLRTSDRGNALR